MQATYHDHKSYKYQVDEEIPGLAETSRARLQGSAVVVHCREH